MSQSLAQAGGGGGKFPDLTVTQRAAIYWPGIQGLMSNPAVWRDRFVLNSKFSFSYLNLCILPIYKTLHKNRDIYTRTEDKYQSSTTLGWDLVSSSPLRPRKQQN